MNALENFWETQINGDPTSNIGKLLNHRWPNTNVPVHESSLDGSIDPDFPVLLPSADFELIALSHMFFEEPWFNIDYEDREKETARLYNEYRQAISSHVGDNGADMDAVFRINRETVYDDFPDFWDSSIAYELGERVHLWVTQKQTWFLSVFQEDKELPIEIRFGRFSVKDTQVLTDHMNAFSLA